MNDIWMKKTNKHEETQENIYFKIWEYFLIDPTVSNFFL